MGLESFKWVLYGDDDTVFFVDGALDMLENLDYNMPYLLSDDVWFVEDDGKHALLLAHRMHASYPLHSACALVQAVRFVASLCFPSRRLSWTQLIAFCAKKCLCKDTMVKLLAPKSC